MESEENFADVDDSICPVCRGSTYVGETIRYCTYDVLFFRYTKLIDIMWSYYDQKTFRYFCILVVKHAITGFILSVSEFHTAISASWEKMFHIIVQAAANPKESFFLVKQRPKNLLLQLENIIQKL